MASCPSAPRRRAASTSPGNVQLHYRGPRHRSPVARSGGGGVERLEARRATRSHPPSPDHRTTTRATRSTTSGACSSRVVGARLRRSRLRAAPFHSLRRCRPTTTLAQLKPTRVHRRLRCAAAPRSPRSRAVPKQPLAPSFTWPAARAPHRNSRRLATRDARS